MVLVTKQQQNSKMNELEKEEEEEEEEESIPKMYVERKMTGKWKP